MKCTIQNLNISGYECLLYLPPEYEKCGDKYPVVYINGGDEIEEIMKGVKPYYRVECEAFILLSIKPGNWNNEYSPWSVPALKKNGEPYGGGASTYLYFITETIKPFIDMNFRTKKEPENTTLIGYSLGGLVSLYALYTSTAFGRIGCLSGSLWFEGWTAFMQSNIPMNPMAKVYLSLGKTEENTRNYRMANVGDCTRKAAEILKQQLNSGVNLTLEWNNGGHFTEIPKRFEKAIIWLMRIN